MSTDQWRICILCLLSDIVYQLRLFDYSNASVWNVNESQSNKCNSNATQVLLTFWIKVKTHNIYTAPRAATAAAAALYATDEGGRAVYRL